MKLKELPLHLAAGFSLYKAECRDRHYFMTLLQKAIGSRRSLFVWKPGADASFQCIQYENDPSGSLRESFNKITERRSVTIVDVLSDVEKRATKYREFIKKTGSRPREEEIATEFKIPYKSIIVCDHLDAYLDKIPELVTLITHPLTNGAWTDYGLGVIAYTPGVVKNPLFNAYCTNIEVPLLDPDGIRQKIDECIDLFGSSPETVEMHQSRDRIKESLTPTLQSMLPYAMDSTISLALISHGRKVNIKKMLDVIEEVKAQSISNNGILTWLPVNSQVSPDTIGAYDDLMNYFRQKALGFRDEAIKLKLDPPKGVVLLGPPGTGKSMVSKSLSYIFGLPTVFLDIAGSFTGIVGASEENLKRALAQVDELNGCVLVIDEADKAFAGATGYVGDSGTARRNFGIFATWLQEHKSKTYTVVTMNATDTVPPEFFRAGRFDKVIHLPLPDESGRKDIILKHFKKRDVSEADLNFTDDEWTLLLEATNRFNGAELQEVVVDSRLAAYDARGVVIPTFSEVLREANSRVPLAVSDKERIEALYQQYKKYEPSVKARDAGVPRKAPGQNEIESFNF